MKKHKTRRFPKQELLDLLDGDETLYQLINDELIDHTRWSVTHEIVFRDKATDEFFRAYYNVGATEYQDESPWEYEDEVIASYVVPVVVHVVRYEPVEI